MLTPEKLNRVTGNGHTHKEVRKECVRYYV